MSQNVPKRTQAAALVVEDRLSDEEIALRCGITRRTLTRWKAEPEFQASIKRMTTARAQGAEAATASKAFHTVTRLIELASLSPAVTNKNIAGQVKACQVIAEIRGEIIHRHEDITKLAPQERDNRIMELLRKGQSTGTKRNEM